MLSSINDLIGLYELAKKMQVVRAISKDDYGHDLIYSASCSIKPTKRAKTV